MTLPELPLVIEASAIALGVIIRIAERKREQYKDWIVYRAVTWVALLSIVLIIIPNPTTQFIGRIGLAVMVGHGIPQVVSWAIKNARKVDED